MSSWNVDTPPHHTFQARGRPPEAVAKSGNPSGRVWRYDAIVKLYFLANSLLASVALLHAQKVNVWLTTDDQKTLLQSQQSVSFSNGGSVATPTVFVDEQERDQSIEGFGASFTDSSAWLMKEIIAPASSLPTVMNSLFDHAAGIGISFVRNPMGAADLARTVYSYDDLSAGATDPNLTSFSIAHDTVDIIPLLLQAKQINPQLRIMATPWSPPGWMKTSGSMIDGASGGTLLPADYTPFANYFVRYLQAYAAAGVNVDYISLQNEPLYDPTGYPGMSMPATTQLSVLRDYVLPALTTNNLTAKVLIYDHNWDQPPYPQTILADSTVAGSPQIGGIAWHWYAGTPGAMSLLHSQYPNRNNYVTEASGGTWIADEVKTDFETITQCMRNWSSSYVKWGMALDQNRGPYIPGGCNDCTPLITVNDTSGAVTYNIDYYTLGHFSKFVLPGAVRVWSSNAPGIVSAAFTNPDFTETLVAYNDSSSSQTFQVTSRGRFFVYTLPALAGATFVWTPGPPGPASRLPMRPAIARAGPPTAYRVSAVSQQIQVSSYNDMSGLETESTADTAGGYDVGYAAVGSWAEYQNIDFGSGVSSVNVRVASDGSGGNLEFHLDAVSGPLVGTATMPVTGGWQTWTTVTAPISGATGVRNLFVVFATGAASGGVANLNWFQFIR
jgi:glucosylceramidase